MESSRRKIILLLLVLIISIPALTPVTSHAYDGVFLQVTISSSPYQYVGLTVHDSSLFENNMLERKLYSKDREMILTWAENKDKITQEDSRRSSLAKTTLVPSLNEALRFLNNGKPFTDKGAFDRASNALKSQSGSYNGYRFSQGNQSGQVPYLTMRGLEDQNYITIKAPSGETRVFVYSMPKYVETDDPAGSNRDGVVSWNEVIDSAQKYEEQGINASNAMTIHEEGMLGKGLASLLSWVMTGFENLLGLESVNELIFNQGIRGNSEMYVYGIFPADWNPYINLMFIVFQVLAWMTVLLSIINLVFRKSLSTISTVRAEVMLEVQQLLIAGFLLVAIFPAFTVLFKGSYLLTDIFANVMDPTARDEFFTNLPMYGNMLAGLLVSLAYFIITIYFNVFYIVRGILIALFIAISPLFVVFITLGKGPRGIFMTWFKHVMAGIIIQPIHAFVLGFLMLLPYGMSGIQAVVFCATLIPLSETIRNILVGNAGAKMDGMSDNLTVWGVGLTAKAAHVAGKGLRKAQDVRNNQIRKDEKTRNARMKEYDLDNRKASHEISYENSMKDIKGKENEYKAAKSRHERLKESGASHAELKQSYREVRSSARDYQKAKKDHSNVIDSRNKFNELYGSQKAGIKRDLKRAERFSVYKRKNRPTEPNARMKTNDRFNRPFHS